MSHIKIVVPSIGYVNLDAPFDFINLHVRGGYVLPTQKPALNTMLSRQNPFGLIVALDDASYAKGQMYYDDGITYGKAIRDLSGRGYST